MKTIYLFILTLLYSITLHAQNTMVIHGYPCTYDTIVHRHIAPGSTYTAFQLENIKENSFTYKMKVHLISVDLSNPYNTLTPYLANGNYFSVNTQVQEVNRQKALGLKPVASVNGGLFVQGNSTSTTRNNYEIAGGLVTGGEVKYEQDKSSSVFYITKDKMANIEDILLHAAVTANGTSRDVNQINHFRDIVPEGISLFCNGMTKTQCSKEKEGMGKDVRLRILSGDKIMVGKNQCEVTQISVGSRHTMSATDVMLSSESGQGLAYLSTLKVGDKVEIEIGYNNNLGQAINVHESITNGFGYAVINGVPQSSNKKNFAIASLGISQDGHTAYIADMEISSNSNASVASFAEMLANIGIWNAIWLDGGPSAEMTVDGDFVTVNSIGLGFNGRMIPSGFMLYSTAPEDDNVTTIETDNRKARVLSKGKSFQFNLYGYNKYGEMIQTEAYKLPNVRISCTAGLGTISGNTFTATGNGKGFITITIDGQESHVTIPVEVLDEEYLHVYPHNIFTGQDRKVQAELYLTKDNKTEKIPAELASWTRSNKYVVSSCTGGLISPFIDGNSQVYVEYQGKRDTINVTVENLEEDVESLQVANIPSQEGIHIPSVPYYVEIEVEGTEDSNAELTYSSGGTLSTISARVPSGCKRTMSITPDYAAADTYPINIMGLSGAQLTGITAYYSSNYQDIIDGIRPLFTGNLGLSFTDDIITVENCGSVPFHGTITLITIDGQQIMKKDVNIAPFNKMSLPRQVKGCLVAVLADTEGQIIQSKVIF